MTNHPAAYPGPARDNTFKRRGPIFRILFHNIGFWLFVLAYPLLGSALYFFIQGRPVRIGSRSSLTPALPLHQTEVSALISLAEVVIDLVYVPWCAVAAWRMVYMLLATRGTRLPELKRVAQGGLPALRGFRGYRGLSYLLVLTAASRFLVQHLPKPLLAASIAWTPIIVHTRSQTSSFMSLPVAGESTEWDKFNIFPESRNNLVMKSAGMAFLSSPALFTGETAAPRRFFPPAEGVLVNSTISQVSVPFMIVDELEWLSNLDVTLNDTLIAAIQKDEVGMLNISSPDGVMTRTVVGNTAILKTTPWIPSPIKFETKPLNRYAFPEPVLFDQERYVAVLVDRIENPKDDKCPAKSKYFGELPALDLLPMHWYFSEGLFAINCYAIAKATIRAGSFSCSNCSIVSRRAAEAVVDLSNQDVSDPLVLPIIDALPEVMLNIAVINGTGAQFWNNLDAYTRGMMMASYQATWNAMSDTFQGSESVTSEIFAPEYLITLEIDMRWFVPWFMVICVAILFGSVFIFVSVWIKGDVVSAVRDPTFAAMLLDLGNVYGRLQSLCMNGELGKQEKKVILQFAGDKNHGQDPSESRRLVVKGGRGDSGDEDSYNLTTWAR